MAFADTAGGYSVEDLDLLRDQLGVALSLVVAGQPLLLELATPTS